MLVVVHSAKILVQRYKVWSSERINDMHRSVRHATSKESASMFASHSQNSKLTLLRAFSHFLSRSLQYPIVFTGDERLGQVLTIKILLRC